MCVGVPGRVIEVTADGSAPPMGRVDAGGVISDVCFIYLPDAVLGDHVVVHAGYAIARVSEGEARDTIALVSRPRA